MPEASMISPPPAASEGPMAAMVPSSMRKISVGKVGRGIVGADDPAAADEGSLRHGGSSSCRKYF